MPNSGKNQVVKVCAEATYGETVATPTWVLVGVVEDGEIGGKFDLNKYFGIGSAAPQIRTPGKVDNTARVSIISPTAAILNQAITRTDGFLTSYNVAMGVSLDSVDAWRGVGLKWNNLSLEVNDTDPLKASLDGILKSQVDSVGTDGYSPTVAHIWERSGAVLTIGGSAFDFVNCKIDVKNNLNAKGVDNSTTDHKRVLAELEEGGLEIDATIQTYTEPTFNLEADCVTDDNITMVLTFTDLCDDSGTPVPLVITCTGGIYVEKRQPIKPNEYVEYSIGINFSGITITGPVA